MFQVELSFPWGILRFGGMLIFSWTTLWTCRYFILKLVNLEASLRAFFLKVWISMPQQHQMQKRAVGELIVLESILVLPQNMKPVWVTCIVLLGWKTGMQIIFIFVFMLYKKGTKVACNYHIMHLFLYNCFRSILFVWSLVFRYFIRLMNKKLNGYTWYCSFCTFLR